MADDVEAERAKVDLLRRRLINVVGHELRTPVATVRGLAELLESSPDEPNRDEIVRALARNASRLERLVDNLLLASEVTTVLPTAPLEPQAVAPVLEQAWRDLGGAAPAPVTGADAVALVRPPALSRIAAAVLDNAMKYGGGEVSVEVTADDGVVAIDVTSGGAAVKPEDLELAFEPFFRGEVAVMTAPGLGIGLTIARQLAEQDGGAVTLAPGPGGRGTVASVRLQRGTVA